MPRRIPDGPVVRTLRAYVAYYNVWPIPDTWHPPQEDDRAQDLIDGVLNDDSVTAAYFVPWKDDRYLAPVAGNLEPAGEDFKDALWSIGEGKRDVRQLRSRPEFSRGRGRR